MPYAIAVQRPESDAPVAKADNYLLWYQWAKDHAPFTSATLGEWTEYLLQLNHPSVRPERTVMMTYGSLPPERIARLLSTKIRPPGKVQKVFVYAVTHDYSVSFTPTDETVSQYLAKQSSA